MQLADNGYKPLAKDDPRLGHVESRSELETVTHQSDNTRCMILCVIVAVLICISEIVVIILYCPWSGCPCVTIAIGAYQTSSTQGSGHEYVVKYQYWLPAYNTTNCFRTDNSRRYSTPPTRRATCISSDYVNFTEFYYDTRIGGCYDIGDGTLNAISMFLVTTSFLAGCVAMGCLADVAVQRCPSQ